MHMKMEKHMRSLLVDAYENGKTYEIYNVA
jgi:hypothetical protein